MSDLYTIVPLTWFDAPNGREMTLGINCQYMVDDKSWTVSLASKLEWCIGSASSRDDAKQKAQEHHEAQLRPWLAEVQGGGE